MQKFIKKPVSILAIKFDWTLAMLDDLKVQGMIVTSLHSHPPSGRVMGLRIATLEGSHRVSEGDYIIKGIAGEFYPCKPEIFEQTYYTEAEYAELGL